MDDDARALEVTCLFVVELVTDHLDDTLDPPLRDAMVAHVAQCPSCIEYLAQIRDTVKTTGRLPPTLLGARIAEELVDQFRLLYGPCFGSHPPLECS